MEDILVNDKIKYLQLDEEIINNFYLSVKSGNNKVFHNIVNEAVTLDDGWIYTIENTLFFIEDIVKNPKKYIKEEQIVVNVAKAKRVNSRALRYLATNTRDIDKIKEDGSVIPRRVLTSQLEEDIGIYENRFVCALVNRLIIFVEQRYRDIMGKNLVNDITNVTYNSVFSYGETEFNFDIKISAKEPPKNKVLLEKNNDLIDKIRVIRKRLQIIKATPFMQKLDNQKAVVSPINKTNLIKMNVNYNNCYKLWLYISAYKMVGFSVEVQDKNLPVDQDYFDDLAFISAVSVKSLLDNEFIRKEAYEKIEFKPKKSKAYKILTNFSYEPTFSRDNKQLSDELINEFYFTKMKQAFKRAVSENVEKSNSNAIVEEKDLKLTFSRFFRSVNEVSDKMFFDVIKFNLKINKTKKRRTPLEKKKEQFSYQRALLMRFKQLAKLKGEEYAKTLRQLSREMLKLDEIKSEVAELDNKRINKREKLLQKRKRLLAIKEKTQKVQADNKIYTDEISEKAEQKRLELEELAKQKRENAKTRRELKMLAYLKEKYEQ